MCIRRTHVCISLHLSLFLSFFLSLTHVWWQACPSPTLMGNIFCPIHAILASVPYRPYTLNIFIHFILGGSGGSIVKQDPNLIGHDLCACEGESVKMI